MANSEQQIQTTRDQMAEYRSHGRAARADRDPLKGGYEDGGAAHAEPGLQEVSDRLSKATIDLVALQEKLMVARIKFQDGVADLSLEKRTEPSAPTRT